MSKRNLTSLKTIEHDREERLSRFSPPQHTPPLLDEMLMHMIIEVDSNRDLSRFRVIKKWRKKVVWNSVIFQVWWRDDIKWMANVDDSA